MDETFVTASSAQFCELTNNLRLHKVQYTKVNGLMHTVSGGNSSNNHQKILRRAIKRSLNNLLKQRRQADLLSRSSVAQKQ